MKQTNITNIFPHTKHNQNLLDFDNDDEDHSMTVNHKTKLGDQTSLSTQKPIQYKPLTTMKRVNGSAITSKAHPSKTIEINSGKNEYQQAFEFLPTQASTVVATKKRIEAPKPQTSSRVQRSKSRQTTGAVNVDEKAQLKQTLAKKDLPLSQDNRSRSYQRRAKEEKDIKMNIDQQNAKKSVSRKRKIHEISQETQEQQQIKDKVSTAKKRKLNDEESTQDKLTPISLEIPKKVKSSKKKSVITKSTASNVLGGLSQATRDLMKKVMDQKKDNLQTPKKETKKRSVLKPKLEQELPFEELKVIDTPPREVKQLSEETKSVLDEIMNDQSLQEQSVLPRVSYEELMKREHEMKFKHSELLSVTRELVLPAHYKVLLEVQGFLDQSLNFLKQCRKQGGLFTEIKKSIEQTYGRRFEVSQFKQILFLAPEFYTHQWENTSQQRDPQLFIDFNTDGQVIPQRELEERQKLFKQKLIQHCKSYHDQFMIKLKSQIQNQILDQSLVFEFDPIKAQMWHHKFDPHSVPQIPEADLKPQFKNQNKRSESVKDFLNKSNFQQRLVQQALEKSQVIGNDQTQFIDSDKELKVLQALSQKTGLSVETLRIIKAKENAIKESQSVMNRSIMADDSSKKLQQSKKLAEMIRSVMNFRNLATIYMEDLIQALNDTMRGHFISQNDMQKEIEDLALVIPEWLQIKDFKGRLVKCNRAISSQQVQQWILQRINNKEAQGGENQEQQQQSSTMRLM